MLGWLGWKANEPTVAQQAAGVFNGDIGITTPIFADENCPPGQRACARARDGGRPEVDERTLARVTLYLCALAVPARRDVGTPATDAGERRFRTLGCGSCHLPQLRTGGSDLAGLRDQTIRPYSDLLLHDMGRAWPTVARTASRPARSDRSSGRRIRYGQSSCSAAKPRRGDPRPLGGDARAAPRAPAEASRAQALAYRQA
ncbi:MAG: di-heme oxidoredictase family protein [Solirubrobacteraceae bacterium]